MENQHQIAVGQRIKILRAHLGMTQAQFAQSLGVKQQNVWSWENGSSPSPEMLTEMEKKYSVNVAFLITGNGEIFTESDAPKNNKQRLSEGKWEAEAYEAVKSERDRLREQLDEMRSWMNKVMNGKVSFPKLPIVPGLHNVKALGDKSGAVAA